MVYTQYEYICLLNIRFLNKSGKRKLPSWHMVLIFSSDRIPCSGLTFINILTLKMNIKTQKLKEHREQSS